MSFKLNSLSRLLLPIGMLILPFFLALLGIRHDLPVRGNSIEEQSIAASFRFFIMPTLSEPCCLTYPPLYFYFTAAVTWFVYILGSGLNMVSNRNVFIADILLDPTLI